MLRSIRARLGAFAVALAIAATGAVFGAVPAQAAGDPAISASNLTFTAGDWGDGIAVSGTGFTPNTTVTVLVTQDTTWTSLGQVDVTADADGAFATTLVPTVQLATANPKQAVLLVAQGATPGEGAVLVLDIRAPKGITANTSSITTDDLTDPQAGVSLVAAGYQPDEQVVVAAVNGGAEITPLTVTADRTGAVRVDNVYVDGGAVAGEIVFTLTGQTSGVVNTIAIAVTGPQVAGSGAEAAVAAAPAPAATGGKKLPVVSG